MTSSSYARGRSTRFGGNSGRVLEPVKVGRLRHFDSVSRNSGSKSSSTKEHTDGMMASNLDEVARDLVAALRSHAFQGEGFEYRRQRGHVISCVALQKHSSAPLCCVDLGVHLDFLPPVGSSEPSQPATMTPSHCEVRRRLTPEPGSDDHWWPLDDHKSAGQIAETFSRHGLAFFHARETFPKYWAEISLDDLRSGGFQAKLPGVTGVRAALLLARVHAFLADWTSAEAFAKYGLEHAPAVASGPKRALRDLLSRQPT